MSLSGRNVSIEAQNIIYLSSVSTNVNSKLTVQGESTFNNNVNINIDDDKNLWFNNNIFEIHNSNLNHYNSNYPSVKYTD